MSLEKKEKSKSELMNLKSLYDEFNFVVKRDEVDMLEELKAKYGKDTFNDIVIFQPFIFKACSKGSKQVVKWALDRYGSHVNIPDQFGNRPIHHAIHSKYVYNFPLSSVNFAMILIFIVDVPKLLEFSSPMGLM